MASRSRDKVKLGGEFTVAACTSIRPEVLT
jgi:hypothetical protein